MSGNLSTFDPTKVEPAATLEALPAGEYTVSVLESIVKNAKANPSNKYLELSLEVVDGPHKGRRLWDRFNLWNANPVAVQIAESQLSALCKAIGIQAINDSSELHNQVISAKVIASRRDNGDVSNEVKSYSSANPVPANTAPGQPW